MAIIAPEAERSGIAAPAVPLSRVRTIEEANLNGFPSDRQLIDGQWFLRLSPGNPARRVNSLNVFDPADDVDCAARLAAARTVFARAGVAFHLRWTPLVPQALTGHVDALGWLRIGETGVWSRPIDADEVMSGESAGVERVTLADWLAAFGATGGTRPEAVTPLALSRLGASLERVAADLICLVARSADGAPAAVAVAVADRDLLGIYDLAVAPSCRRSGLGRQMVRACLAHGAAAGCREAWLQVTAENASARALYRGLGFSEAYRYHYRAPPDAD
ncbi:GNAT family N-acetyltransferase [Stappia taiwanensis]|uniref:GNAT family N-acetyltransferase n=1 Tax=Stappia taiwanensis TaxID=992267 RepID=A0A838XWF2_9HYPH|nr:N-acetyltransferase [Stappia taiwanensis]MBA4611364.1 GNAT family N-acetyltransferase [Stappia taiwanensis]GGF00856.1 acetyltransferase [Stappia taiwanensis]